MNGIINYPGTTEFTIPADGTGSSKLWSTKTPDQIIRDLTGLTNAVVATTNGREIPDTLLIPLTRYNTISTTRMGSVSDTTILEYFLKTSPYITKVEWLVELSGAGAGNSDRIMALANDEMHLTLEIPQLFEQFDPQQKGMEFEIPCHCETAGVIVYYPLSIAFGDGV